MWNGSCTLFFFFFLLHCSHVAWPSSILPFPQAAKTSQTVGNTRYCGGGAEAPGTPGQLSAHRTPQVPLCTASRSPPWPPVPARSRTPPPVPARSRTPPSPRTSGHRWWPAGTCSSSPRPLSSIQEVWFPSEERHHTKSTNRHISCPNVINILKSKWKTGLVVKIPTLGLYILQRWRVRNRVPAV